MQVVDVIGRRGLDARFISLSKIEAGKLVIETADFDLESLGTEVTQMFAQSAGEKGIALDFAVTDGVPSRLHGDVARLRQVLINLVGNAVKFTYVFAFEYAALHYANPRRNRYAYRLECFDQDWISTDAKQRFAQYSNLAPGDYVFRVKASNPDGVWNEAGSSVRITILPPPWKTWWAYSLYTLAFAAVVLGYVHSHRKELRRERAAAEREREISRRLRQVDKLKDEFLANTSHELRTPLYGITGLAESLVDGATGELPAETKSAARGPSPAVAAGERALGRGRGARAPAE